MCNMQVSMLHHDPYLPHQAHQALQLARLPAAGAPQHTQKPLTRHLVLH